jgi:hypothetical protein
MATENQNLPSIIQPETADSRVTISYQRRNVTMYYVQDQELDTIGTASSESSLYMGFGGITGGGAVTALATLLTVDITNPNIFASFVAGFLVTFLLTLFLGIKAYQSTRESKKHIERIKAQSLQSGSNNQSL